ncbi:MAG: acyl-CoA/acyl-ACP dehydrogenase [Rhizobiaceae bacterium]|nr:acyl-CoA/acyl-ACP dehydrogenase [Rhizobiaceae bacterium]
MMFSLSSEQRLIQESMAKLVARDIEPVLKSHPTHEPLPKEPMRKILELLASQGLTCARMSEAEGGSGLSAMTMGLMFEQLPPVVAMCLMSHEVTIHRIFMESSPEQRERLLPDLISARKIACTGTTEPGGGSNSHAISTRAKRSGEHVVINGRKMWITNAAICDVMNVTASLGTRSDGQNEIIRVAVDRAESPFETDTIPVLGLQQGHLGEVNFDDCTAFSRNTLGSVGDAPRILTLTWLINRAIYGLIAVHLAQKALDAALVYAKERHQFGRPIGGFQLIQEALSEIATAVTTSRVLCYHALACIDNGERANQVSAMAKRYSIAQSQKAITLAMEIHGAMGISREVGLEQLYRDVRMLPIPDGTNQILTLIEGRELTGLPAFRG